MPGPATAWSGTWTSSPPRPGHQLTYSVGWALGERERAALRLVPGDAWQIAIDGRGEVRERRADDACADIYCAHRGCWIEEAHVTQLTGLLRKGPGGDQVNAAWLTAAMIATVLLAWLKLLAWVATWPALSPRRCASCMPPPAWSAADGAAA